MKKTSYQQVQKLDQGYLTRFLIKNSGKNIFVSTSDILWISSSGNYVRIHLEEDEYLVRGALSKMEDKLDPDQFVRIHQSTIVNVGKIKFTKSALYGGYEVVLKNEEKLKMSRTYKEALSDFVLNL